MSAARPLSIVIPAYNAREHLTATIGAAVDEVERSGAFEAELVLVDDGSTDGSAEVAREACGERLPFRLVQQPNRGRFEARRAGLEAARQDLVLLLDSRVRLEPGALSFVAGELDRGARVYNGHVDVPVEGNPFAAFSKLLAELSWSRYFDDPRTTSFDASTFELYPKGTTCLLAPRQLLLDACSAFRSRYADSRSANDDTPLLRWVAEREPIHISPGFACVYRARSSPASFLRHSFHRGIVFLDGHGRRGSRYFPAVIAFYPVSALLAARSVRRPLLAPATAAALSLAAGALAVRKRKSRFESLSFAALAPMYAAAHGAGMWRGLAMAVRSRLEKRARP